MSPLQHATTYELIGLVKATLVFSNTNYSNWTTRHVMVLILEGILEDSNYLWALKSSKTNVKSFYSFLEFKRRWREAEVCELVRLCLLSILTQFIPANQVALLRDDGLATVENYSNVQMDRVCERIRNTTNSVDFKIIFESGKIIKTDF